ncbi:MAG: FAD-dependent oxidoreductase [Candidatus Thorarchaeota archaeon]
MAVHKYDVVIVGAGPGGSIAAKEAAEKGLKTIFFERGRKPGEKNSSGCGLGPRMWLDFDIMKELTPEGCPSMRAGAAACNYFVNSDNIVAGYVMTRPTESADAPILRLGLTEELFFRRTEKEVFHELGHVLGLRHCSKHCVMLFSNSLADTENKPGNYCTDCLQRLELE